MIAKSGDIANQSVHLQDRRGPMPGSFGLSSCRGGRSPVGSFGERYGDAAVRWAYKKSSSIQKMVIDPNSGTTTAHK
jgi:hypothetical protein